MFSKLSCMVGFKLRLPFKLFKLKGMLSMSIYSSLRKAGALCIMLAAVFFMSACNSLPPDASAPHLEIQKVALDNQDKNNPYFIIDYTLKHDSPEALQLFELKATIFIRGELAASLNKKLTKEMIDPHQLHTLQLEVPINHMSKASLDSLSNSSLVVLDGSCALQAVFSQDKNQSAFNPTVSFVGYIRSAEQSDFKSALKPSPVRSDLNPQSSAIPLPRPVLTTDETASPENSSTPNASSAVGSTLSVNSAEGSNVPVNSTVIVNSAVPADSATSNTSAASNLPAAAPSNASVATSDPVADAVLKIEQQSSVDTTSAPAPVDNTTNVAVPVSSVQQAPVQAHTMQPISGANNSQIVPSINPQQSAQPQPVQQMPAQNQQLIPDANVQFGTIQGNTQQ